MAPSPGVGGSWGSASGWCWGACQRVREQSDALQLRGNALSRPPCDVGTALVSVQRSFAERFPSTCFAVPWAHSLRRPPQAPVAWRKGWQLWVFAPSGHLLLTCPAGCYLGDTDNALIVQDALQSCQSGASGELEQRQCFFTKACNEPVELLARGDCVWASDRDASIGQKSPPQGTSRDGFHATSWL